MTSNGYNVMGWQPNEDGSDVLVDTVSPLKIMSAENLTSAPEQTTKAYIDGVIDKNDSNVTSTTGRLVNISVYDNLGYSYIVQCSINNPQEDVTAKTMTYDLKPVKLIDSTGATLYDASATGGTGPTLTLGTTEIVFDTTNGSIKTPTPNGDKEAPVKLTIAGIPAFGEDISIDLANLKMYDNKGTSTVAGHYGDVQGRNAGRKKGALSGVAIQQDGKIYGSYDNGTSKLLGQIAVASFANATGLEKIGDNLYDTTQNSGEFDGIGKDITSDGAGAMKTGVLEMSNVDLSAEFTEMITTQRGFQANSRIITVSDTMLEELINLKR